MADIAIFRINYKSDFILTLQSDAGWLTPFCIKFWTGAPSQAYFVGYNGSTYTHCAPVDGDPTRLTVQFDNHHLPIGDLKYQIGYHFTVDDFPTTVEDEVINQGAVIIDQDGTLMQVMLDFNGETAPDIMFNLGVQVSQGERLYFDDKLYKVLQTHTPQEDWRPDTTASLYVQVIAESDAGTIDNPIAFEVNMELVEGKYYTEAGVKYLCVRALAQSVWHLADLVGNYVEVVN